ncbi:unnamed protein product [Notodromas monacha]|uniref:phosphatidate phosphatase n=1 Tax=Notodromas monacha TaxID=399045 RepID=A0A7R9BH07_9CRUS|nr:unnamed protein product [Notodromas monacha]CAG0915316.1 unnamed protein product [Notodromas monacha]
MNYFGLGRYFHNVREFYKEINAATLTGAIDVVIVRQPDGTYLSSPFHVRFGKLGVLRAREKIVDITINGEEKELHMKLGENGEGFFVIEAGEDEELPAELATSPINTMGGELMDLNLGARAAELERLEQRVPSDQEMESSSSFQPDRDRMAQELVQQLNEDRKNDLNVANAEQGNVASSGSSSEEKSQQTNNRRKRRRKKAAAKPPERSPEKDEDIFEMEDFRVSDGDPGDDTTSAADNDFEDVASFPESRRVSEIHPFSDTDLSPVASPHLSRAETPIKSDTEYELSEHRTDASESARTSGPPGSQLRWDWGELPARQTPATASSAVGETQSSAEAAMTASTSATPATAEDVVTQETEEETEAAPSMLGSMFSFIRRSKNPATRVRKERRGLSSSAILTNTTAATTTANATTTKTTAAAGTGVMMSQLDEERVVAQVLEPAPPSVSAEPPAPAPPLPHAALPLTGIYLDDLTDDVEPEIAALYLRSGRTMRSEVSHNVQHFRGPSDEDLDSGKGPSLSHSPNSNLGEDPAQASDSDDGAAQMKPSKRRALDALSLSNVELSKCGGWNQEGGPNPADFNAKKVTFEHLCEDPNLFTSSDLVVQLNGRYLPIQTALRAVWSELVFRRPLPEDVLERHFNRELEAGKSKSSYWFSGWRRTSTATTPPKSVAAVKPTAQVHAVKAMSEPDLVTNIPTNTSASLGDQHHFHHHQQQQHELMMPREQGKDKEHVKDRQLDEDEEEEEEDDGLENEADTRRSSSRGARVGKLGSSGGRSLSEPSPSAGKLGYRRSLSALSETQSQESLGHHRKSLRLTSDQVEALNLRDGVNECVFSVTTAYQGTSKCGCHIFLWNWTDKIVISDIDGTITRSDVLGHILPMIGNSWAQSGVSQLFTKIARNNYKFLYLSARAIGQARITRDYLRSIRQDDHELPIGPVMLNPSSLLSAFHREVIIKKPEEFKIACMKDVLALFPKDVNPFYAGYGNRINDAWAYKAVGVPVSRIFTINHRGEVRHELTQTFQTSYCGLTYMVDMVFPPRPETDVESWSSESQPQAGGNPSAEELALASDHEIYSDFLYWRDPLPEPQELADAVRKPGAISNQTDLVVAAGPDAFIKVRESSSV